MNIADPGPSLRSPPGAPDRSVAGLPLVPQRHYGRWATALLVIAVLALLGRAFANAQIDWGVVGHYLTATALFHGFLHTLLVTAAAMLLGLALGVVFAVMRLSHNPVTSGVAWLYVWVFRGTPVLLQILLWFNLSVVFPTLGIPGLFHASTISVITPFVAALLALGVNEGAYLTEIIRGGIMSVDEGQEEAATALGLSRMQSLRTIIIPQAMRVIVPTLGNETIGMLKTSSLVSVIGYTELLNQAQNIYNLNDRIIELLIVAAAWYLLATSILSTGQYYLERRMGRSLQRARPRASVERLFIHIVGLVSARVRGAGQSK